MPKSLLFKRIGLVAILAAWAGATAWLGWSYYQTQQNIEKNDAKMIVSKLQKLMQTPPEEPLVATITDVEKLKQNEPFYKNASNGDKVVIWKEKAVIYRQEANKIVDFGVVIRQPQAQVAGDQTGPNEETETGPAPSPTPAR